MKPLQSLPLIALFALPLTSFAQNKDFHGPKEWKNLAPGARFMDRFEPLPAVGKLTSDTWGIDKVKPRYIDNGIEDPKWSYWGGNIIKDEKGTYHLFVCRWPENNPKGHFMWNRSTVVHTTSKSRFGPFKVKQEIGGGHNPEIYQLSDGRYVLYSIGKYYLGETINGPWKKKKFKFDSRDRRIIEGLSNMSFTTREDGSVLMVDRGGGIWLSKSGLGPWEMVTQDRAYPAIKGRFEDPVIWKTPVQYHMIVNDWYGRIAYHLRSKDGVKWVTDPGKAYAPGIAVHADGHKVDWYKYERIKIFQDEHGRAIQANFAVIDDKKHSDKGGDIHSSKNISMPLTPGRLITLQNKVMPTDQTKEIRVRIAAEKGFDPQKDIDLTSLKFGAPHEVDYGRGASLIKTEKAGKDLIAVFSGKGNGFTKENFAGKLLGKTSQGKLLFGFTRLPWVTYGEPILSSRNPKLIQENGTLKLQVEVSNYGLSASPSSKVKIEIVSEDGSYKKSVSYDLGEMKPWQKSLITQNAPEGMKADTEYLYTVTTGENTGHPLVYKTYRPKKRKK